MTKKLNYQKLNDKERSSEYNWNDRTGEEKKPQFYGITDKQRALMIKLGIKFDNRTTKRDAIDLISKHLKSDKNS